LHIRVRGCRNPGERQLLDLFKTSGGSDNAQHYSTPEGPVITNRPDI